MRFGSLAGQMTFPFGRAPAPASHSASQESKAASETHVTSGPSGSGSSASADLQRSLESRLRAQMDSAGSTLFALTWKERVTPAGRRICALRGSVPRISDSGCTSWPTATAKDSASSGVLGYPTTGTHPSGTTLTDAARLAAWPTPKRHDGERGGSAGHEDGRRSNLVDRVQLSSWATPAAREAGGTPEQFLARKRKAVAKGANLGVSLTSLSMQAQLARNSRPLNEQAVQLAVSGPTPSGSPAATTAAEQLNPALSRWLMGYHAAWGDSAPNASAWRQWQAFLASR
jgi:hypothetical protein